MTAVLQSRTKLYLFLFSITLGTLLAGVLLAQPIAGGARNVTAVSPEHRYDLIQSNVTRFYTLRVDKQTGRTWQLTERGGRKVWDDVRFHDGQTHLANLPDGVNFQVLASVLVPREIFLWNVHTGKTWMLDQEPDRGRLFWRMVDDQ